ncbi:energy-coupling factor transporter ATPase [Mycoplasmopsis gallinarum]
MLIEIKKLKHIFSPKTPNEHMALNEVSATITNGEFIGIIGQTGSGKTTFIEHLNALLHPTSGTINWKYDLERKLNFKQKRVALKNYKNDLIKQKLNKQEQKNKIKEFKLSLKKPTRINFDVSLRKKMKKFKYAKDIREQIGIVFQFAEYQLFEESIAKDIAFGPISFGVSKEEALKRAEKYLNLVGLDSSYLDKSPFGLSGGQKRRVALAGILAMEPDFIVADEPTAGLDPAGVVEILEIFTNLHKMGKTVIIVTHDLDNVLEVTQRILMFKDGKIVKDGNTYAVLNDTKFLEANYMEPPKLLAFANKLREKNIPVPEVHTINELAKFLNEYRLKKKGAK